MPNWVRTVTYAHTLSIYHLFIFGYYTICIVYSFIYLLVYFFNFTLSACWSLYSSFTHFNLLIFSFLSSSSPFIISSFFCLHLYFFVLFSFFFFPSLYFILTILFFLLNSEMTRAMASVPTVRLPMENPPEGYWEECDLGVCDKKKVLDSNLQ